MRHYLIRLLRCSLVVGFASFVMPLSAWAQITTPSAATVYELTQENNGQRLGAWLSAHPLDDITYPLGVMWMTPEEKQRQELEKEKLRKTMLHLHDVGLMRKAEKQGLSSLLQRMQVTGRVLLSALEPRWLEIQPVRDPVLKAGDALEIPQRPNTVRVMGSTGEVCEIPFTSGMHAKTYAFACMGEAMGSWAWVVQADGRINKVGLASWNHFQANLPSPGAWVWVPLAGSPLPDSFNEAWASWLANQGVSNRLALTTFEGFVRLPAALKEEPAWAGLSYAPPSGQYSASNWGYVGLVQTPTARMQKAGNLGVSMSNTQPQTHVNLFLQPLSWVEGGIRYTDVSNRLYSVTFAFSGDQSYKDKSIDLKLGVLSESDVVPEVAVGWRDIAGTGLFSSEYVVANKRYGVLDYSLGMAWGNLGGRGNVSNPLSKFLGSKFDTRTSSSSSTGGQFAASSWFHGPSALFAGVSYQSPWNTEFKLEYDGNNYQNEPQSNNFKAKSPFNFAAVYRLTPGIDLNFGVVRGDTLTFGFSMFTDIAGMYMPKLSDPPKPSPFLPRPTASPQWQITANEIELQTQWRVRQMYQSEQGDKVTLVFDEALTPYPRTRLDKALAVLNRDAPQEVEDFNFEFRSVNETLASQSINRTTWTASQTQPARTQEGYVLPKLNYDKVGPFQEKPLLGLKPARASLDPSLDLLYVLQGPDAFAIYQFSAALTAKAQLPGDINLSAMSRLRLFGNYDKYKNPGASSLPRVRTYLREYFVTSETTLANLTLSKSVRLSRDIFVSGYVGYFEEMFAGKGGEVLFRQPGSAWAVGVDVNQVQQRDFAQDLRLRDYKVDTGHLTGYWQTPFDNVFTSVSYGQYLAGDRGATLTMAKIFSNGSSMGAWATKTNVPAAIFGEGSFDKGIFFNVPFDAFMTRSSRINASFGWRPLTRDGGQKVNRPLSLMGETGWLDPMVYSNNTMALPPESTVAPDDYRALRR